MNTPSQPIRIPADWGPTEVGAHLRSLREQFSLTTQQVSERLHIRARYIAAMEEAKYEQMPGKVYARGYLHTYAEFLGLDPEQVVSQCFEGVIAESAAPKVVPAFGRIEPVVKPAVVAPKEAPEAKPVVAPAAYTAKTFTSPPVSYRSPWLLPATAVALLVLGGVLYTAMSGSDSAEIASGVSPVPESLLNSVRNEVMPSGRNFTCLSGNTLLGCFFAQDTLQQLQELEAWTSNGEVGGIRLSPAELPAPVKAAPAAESADDAQ